MQKYMNNLKKALFLKSSTKQRNEIIKDLTIEFSNYMEEGMTIPELYKRFGTPKVMAKVLLEECNNNDCLTQFHMFKRKHKEFIITQVVFLCLFLALQILALSVVPHFEQLAYRNLAGDYFFTTIFSKFMIIISTIVVCIILYSCWKLLKKEMYMGYNIIQGSIFLLNEFLYVRYLGNLVSPQNSAYYFEIYIASVIMLSIFIFCISKKEVWYMDAQIKKGVLEMCILQKLSAKDYYGYNLMQEMKTLFPEVSDSTFYSILRRLNKMGDAIIYYGNDSGGPQRKYYQITEQGKMSLKKKNEEWMQLQKIVLSLNSGQ